MQKVIQADGCIVKFCFHLRATGKDRNQKNEEKPKPEDKTKKSFIPENNIHNIIL